MEASTTNRYSGWVTFAGVMFLVGGAANVIWGVAALDEKEYLRESSLLFSTLTFWGWVGIISGAVLLAGAVLLLSRSPAGPAVGIVLAALSAIFWLFALPLLPIFAMTAIFIDALIIYGLVQYGETSGGGAALPGSEPGAGRASHTDRPPA